MKILNTGKRVLSLILLFRIIVPFLIFAYPLLAFFLSLLLDMFDGQLFYNAGYYWEDYNKADKLLDVWWYIFILLYLLSSPIFPIISLLFIYRLVGQFIGVTNNNEKIYMLFPNIFEWFFAAFLLFPSFSLGVLLVGSALWAVFVEWLIHKSNVHILSKYLFHNEIKWRYKTKETSK